MALHATSVSISMLLVESPDMLAYIDDDALLAPLQGQCRVLDCAGYTYPIFVDPTTQCRGRQPEHLFSHGGDQHQPQNPNEVHTCTEFSLWGFDGLPP